jgi:hypothetical protein
VLLAVRSPLQPYLLQKHRTSSVAGAFAFARFARFFPLRRAITLQVLLCLQREIQLKAFLVLPLLQLFIGAASLSSISQFLKEENDATTN